MYTLMLTELEIKAICDPLQDTLAILSHEGVRSRILLLAQVEKLNLGEWHFEFVKDYG